PKWVVEGKTLLESGTEAWGKGWVKLTGLWWQLEESTGFKSSAKGFAPSGRPDEVGHWVKCARKGEPHIVDVAAFASRWMTWWKGINPEWRVGPDQALKRAEDGPWEVMERPGVNGFLNVLICLQWWKDAGGDGNWAAAVEDVTWAMER
ncbi:hypothetical protein C8F04DRAFT_962512, partial [Mycena alexandri]